MPEREVRRSGAGQRGLAPAPSTLAHARGEGLAVRRVVGGQEQSACWTSRVQDKGPPVSAELQPEANSRVGRQEVSKAGGRGGGGSPGARHWRRPGHRTAEWEGVLTVQLPLTALRP